MFASIEEAIARLRVGDMLILVDDENRENEGDLIIAAEHVSPESVNFMVTNGRGLVCVPLTEERADQLGLTPMCPENTALHGTRFAVSVDAASGIATGISANDRAHTIRRLADPAAQPADFARPGHVFPLIARHGGVLHRPGHTEATVDLTRLAGLHPVGVLCEILNRDGSMARLPQLEGVAAQHGLAIVSITDLIAYRRDTESLAGSVAGEASIEIPPDPRDQGHRKTNREEPGHRRTRA